MSDPARPARLRHAADARECAQRVVDSLRRQLDEITGDLLAKTGELAEAEARLLEAEAGEKREWNEGATAAVVLPFATRTGAKGAS